MDICIHEGNDKNIVQIGQIKPILSAIKQSSISCVPTDSIISNGTSDTQTTIEAPNDEDVVSENDVTTSETFIQEVPEHHEIETSQFLTKAMKKMIEIITLLAVPRHDMPNELLL